MSEHDMRPEDWDGFWSLSRSLRAVQERGAPAIGETVTRDGREFVCISIRTNGQVDLAAIPEGMTAMDLGRRFNPSKVERRVEFYRETPR
jgi:hypothetical protein